MAVIRRATPKGNFTIVRNEVAQDNDLSFRARGVLIYLLSLPDDWRTDSVKLGQISKEGRDAIRSALTELSDRGYLERNKFQNELGQWVTEWVVHEQINAHLETPEDGFSVIGKSGAIQRTNTKNLLNKLQPSVDVTARDVVGRYVDKWRELHGEEPLARQIGQLAREARVMLESGVDAQRLLLSAEKCATDGHARLDASYSWITAQNTRGTSGARSDNLNQGLNLINKFQQQEGKELEGEAFRDSADSDDG